MLLWIPILLCVFVMSLADSLPDRFAGFPAVRWLRGNRAQRGFVLGILVGMPAHLLFSEFFYARQIRPTGIATIADYYHQFGEPRRIRAASRGGKTYYHLHGHLPAFSLMALPSEPAAYVFDANGKFREWCRDPGDTSSYWRDWPETGESIDPKELRARLAIPD